LRHSDGESGNGNATAVEMRDNVLKQYPGLGMEFTLNDRINTYFPTQNQAR
jgi:hypothetical protein